MGWRRWGRLLGAGVLGLLVLLLPAALLGPAGPGGAGTGLSAGRSAADAAPGGQPSAGEIAGQTAATAAPGGQTSPDETAGETSGQTTATAAPGGQTSPDETAEETVSDETAGQTAAFPAGEYRAVWVSYLEWQRMDFSDAAAFRADAAAMLDDIAGLGANVVLAHVRPFGDALYPSELFPWSHLAAGVQGRDPGFDPLAILVQAAHDRGLQLEAWVNPYRLQAGGVPELSDGSLADLHPDWVRRAGDGLYLDPAEPRVRAYIAAGVAELCAGYDIDGVHFDDYFYPTTDPAFDADAYAAYCAGADDPLPLADWRRSNVDALVALCCQTAHRYGVRFGVAPQGDPAQNRDAQYSDAARWLAEGGYVDYLMPQLYWGLEYQRGADASHSLAELADAWLAMPRRGDVALYFGLGAYRIGAGDGGDRTGPDSEWQRGDALARQAEALAAAGGQGVGLYRYDSLFANDAFPGLAAREADALRELWRN